MAKGETYDGKPTSDSDPVLVEFIRSLNNPQIIAFADWLQDKRDELQAAILQLREVDISFLTHQEYDDLNIKDAQISGAAALYITMLLSFNEAIGDEDVIDLTQFEIPNYLLVFYDDDGEC